MSYKQKNKQNSKQNNKQHDFFVHCPGQDAQDAQNYAIDVFNAILSQSVNAKEVTDRAFERLQSAVSDEDAKRPLTRKKTVRCVAVKNRADRGVESGRNSDVGTGGEKSAEQSRDETIRPTEGVCVEQTHDAVNHPSHYCRGGIECIDAIQSAVSELSGIEAWLTGSIIKYIWRWKWKNGTEDLRKARFYLDRLIQQQERVREQFQSERK